MISVIRSVCCGGFSLSCCNTLEIKNVFSTTTTIATTATTTLHTVPFSSVCVFAVLDMFSFLFSNTYTSVFFTHTHTACCLDTLLCISLCYTHIDSKGHLLKCFCNSKLLTLWENSADINACLVLYCVKPLYRQFSVLPWEGRRGWK